MNRIRRTDAKAYFANERTFLHWQSMSITIGSISAAILGIWSQNTKHSGFVFHAVHVLCLVSLFIAVVLNCFTLMNFIRRNRALDLQLDNCHDSRSPAIFLTATLVVVIGIIFVAGVIDYND
eukprot:g7669.t1